MILAFDLATNTGWAAGDGSAFPSIGHVTMPATGEDVGIYADFWERWLIVTLDDWKPTHVAFEAPILPRETTPSTVMKLSGLVWELEKQCRRRKIEYAQIPGSTVKKYLTGDGRAQKPDMVRWARKVGAGVKTHDEADAFAVWLTSIQYYAPGHLKAWEDRKFQAASSL